MRLNPDCIRDILLCVEEKIDSNNESLSIGDLKKMLPDYDANTLCYHVMQIDRANLVIGVVYILNGPVSIRDLSPKGHEFLANIRSNSNWNRVKGISEKVGSASLDAIIQISSNVITNLITQQF